MALKGYCSAADVADLVGLTFTSTQEAHAVRLIERAEGLIDLETDRAWLTGVLTDEAYFRAAYRLGHLYLRYAPVASVATLKGRAALGETETTLVADTDYEVMDLTGGLVRLLYPASYDRLRVTYTPVATVPALITQATAELVGAWMEPTLRPADWPDTHGLESFTLPDLSVTFGKSGPGAGLEFPPTVQSVLDLFRYQVHA
jgi:hypothetical protein